jgi:hypothetical protein
MLPKFHPAAFLGAVILICSVWLWVRPPVSAIETAVRGGTPRAARIVPASIELDGAILERYLGKYEGRGGFTVDLSMKDGKLLAHAGAFPYELRATAETKFFLMVPSSLSSVPGGAPAGVDVEFDVARDGTVRGFAANTEFGLIEMKRVR